MYTYTRLVIYSYLLSPVCSTYLLKIFLHMVSSNMKRPVLKSDPDQLPPPKQQHLPRRRAIIQPRPFKKKNFILPHIYTHTYLHSNTHTQPVLVLYLQHSRPNRCQPNTPSTTYSTYFTPFTLMLISRTQLIRLSINFICYRPKSVIIYTRGCYHTLIYYILSSIHGHPIYYLYSL